MKRHNLICLAWIATSAGVSGESTITPSGATGGSIPYPYNVGTYTTWHSDPISIDAISDGSAVTSVALTGLDDVLQDNGARVDTGTFYLLRYVIPLSAPVFHIDFTAAVAYPGGAEELLVEAMNRDGVSSRTVQWELNAVHSRTFGLTFYRDRNDGNQGALGQAWGLDELQQPDGSVIIVLQGSYFAQGDVPGFVNSHLYDVSASLPSLDGFPFRRGDIDGSQTIDLSDPIVLLRRLFQGEDSVACEDAADTNDDGKLDLTDAIVILGSLFQGRGPLPVPGAEGCGRDPTPDELECGAGCR